MRLLLVAVLLAFGCSPKPDPSEGSITVFAAASLTDALYELVSLFELQQPGITVHTHVGPTSLLARQIQQGAPADIFMAASPDWVDYLREEDLIKGPEINFAGNTLIVLGSPVAPSVTNFSELKSVQHLAVADPSHVPAGVYSKHALQCAGIWEVMESVVIPTLDVRAALTAVISEAADYAMVYGSDAGLAPELKFMFQVPDSCTPEIDYLICVLRGSESPKLAADFITFATDSTRKNLWARFGFSS